MASNLHVTVWNEGKHEQINKKVQKVYPEGIHGAIANHLNEQKGIKAITATLDEPEHGLTEKVLAKTDVLTWWGHMAHHMVDDKIVDRVQERVLDGMGLIVLHSGHFSKIFRRMIGTSGTLKWRDVGERERVWTVNPSHPIAQGVPEHFLIPHEEMYGEPFGIPEPDELVFVSWFQGGEVFRSGCCFNRGNGRLFYFCPGHETYPTYRQEEVLQVITNAVRWAAPRIEKKMMCAMVQPQEKLGK